MELEGESEDLLTTTEHCTVYKNITVDCTAQSWEDLVGWKAVIQSSECGVHSGMKCETKCHETCISIISHSLPNSCCKRKV